MSVEPIQIIYSSKIFGGTNESISVYEDRVIIYYPNQQGPKTEEFFYSQLADLYLFRGLLYASLSLRTHSGASFLVRWLPKSEARRVASFIGRRIRQT